MNKNPLISENVFPIVELAKRLRELEKHMPNQDITLYQFGAFLAGVLSDQEGGVDEILPGGYIFALELALGDLQAGTYSATGKPVHNKLVGCSHIVFSELRGMMLRIAEAILPEDFVAEVAQVMKQIEQVEE